MAKLSSYTNARCVNLATRLYSTKINSNLERVKKTDLIGPPHPISNLPPIVFARPQDETNLEKQYREARQDTQVWNQDFWTKHNTSFVEERKQFQDTLKAEGKSSLSADDMSVFYKRFLDKNWRTHFNYNVAWYRRNIQLVFLEFRVRLSKLKFK